MLANILIAPVLALALGAGLYLLYRRWRHVLLVRASIAVLWLSLTALFALAFYERYWRWRACFNELGRCYDTEAGVMVEQAGFIWGAAAIAFGLLFSRSLWRLRRQISSIRL
jgi:hypothetical protein